MWRFRDTYNLFLNLWPLASRGGHYSIGRQLNITDGVTLSDLDEYDELVRQKIEVSAVHGPLRRLFSTLSFQHNLLKQDLFVGLVAEYLKTLASSFCRSKCHMRPVLFIGIFIPLWLKPLYGWSFSFQTKLTPLFLAQYVDSGEKGPTSSGGNKYRWLTVFELTCLTEKLTSKIGSNVVFDFSGLDLSLRDHRRCFISSLMTIQLATMGAYSNRSVKSRFFIFPPSLIRYVSKRVWDSHVLKHFLFFSTCYRFFRSRN